MIFFILLLLLTLYAQLFIAPCYQALQSVFFLLRKDKIILLP